MDKILVVIANIFHLTAIALKRFGVILQSTYCMYD